MVCHWQQTPFNKGIGMISAVIVAGGKGTRMGADRNKILLPLLGEEIILRTVSVFNDCPQINEIIVVTAECDIDVMSEIIRRNTFTKVTQITTGGDTRRQSVYNGLRHVNGDIVLIHDGARCLVTENEITSVIADVKKFGAAAVGVKVKDTLKTIDNNGNITSTVDRERTIQIQTPQAFKTDEILSLHEKAALDGVDVTDDCSIFEYYGKTVHVTLGSYDNIKITTPEDIEIGENILKRRAVQ